MRIGKLHFKNFRGFEDFELDLSNNRLAVFVGENGSGKSSLLDGVRYLFLKLLNVEAPFRQKDVKAGCSFDDFYSLLSISVNQEYLETTVIGDKQKADSLFDYLNDLIVDNPERNIPFFSFYSSLRDFEEREIDEKSFLYLENQLKSYHRAVSSKSLRYDLFYNWFKEEEDAENEVRLNNDNSYRSKQLDAVRSAIIAFLPYKSLIVGLKFKGRPKERLIIEFEDHELSFDQLSDGERSVLVLVGDIARRIAIANPSLENPLEGEGIVMIDEIDSHLHPKWQEKVVPALMRTFPNIQFLITTHSPHVVRNIQRDDLFILKDFKLEEVKPHVHGKDIGDVISEIFGQNPKHPSVEKALLQLSEMIENEELEAAKSKLKELIQQVGDEDSNVSHIRSMIDFWE